jgi:ATP-dependent Clp protease ATP-binding subunit ClpA
LLCALLVQANGLVASFLPTAGRTQETILCGNRDALAEKPRVQDQTQLHESIEFARALKSADKAARRKNDDYISCKHIFLSLLGVGSTRRLLESEGLNE